MIKIIYDQPPPKIRHHDGVEEIYCIIRKKWLHITPEEWVRQNFLSHLVNDLGFAASLIAVEKQLVLGELKKRFDIVVYKNAIDPFMIVECKEMNSSLNEKVLLQALRYNIPLRAPYLVLTNGSYCMAFETDNGELRELAHLPLIK